MKKFLLLSFLLLVPMRSWGLIPAPWTNPLITHDTISSILSAIITLKTMGESPEMGAIFNVHEEELGALVDGDESYQVSQGTGSKASDLGISAYDYMKEKVFDSKTKSAYGELNKKLTSGADMTAVVKELFFIEKDEDNTEANQKEVVARRTAYLTAISRDYINEAYNVQKKLIDDMDSISADINGNGSIGATSGADQTWKAINKALIADIGLQIQLMELDAAKFLSVQPIIIMTEKRPSTDGEGGNS